MKRVLHFPGEMTQGGVESLLMGWYNRIDRNIIQFDFCVARDYSAPIDDDIMKLGGRVFYSLPMKQIGVVKHIKEIKRIISDNGPYDAVHIHSIHMGVFSLIAAKFSNVPIRVYHSHNVQNATLKRFPSLIRRFIESVCSTIINKYATKRVACSNEAGRFVFKQYPFSVIKNSIDLGRFSPYSEEKRTQLRTQYGLPSDLIIVGNVGRFVEEKNQRLFLDLFTYDSSHEGRLFFLLVGDGKEREIIERKVQSLGARNRFMFCGSQKNTEDYYNCMDVFCMPPVYEGLGIVAIEAQACGVPCLVSDVVPKEADMGLGQFVSLSLDDSPEKWCQDLYSLHQREKLKPELIREQIENKGYSISNTIKFIESQLYN